MVAFADLVAGKAAAPTYGGESQPVATNRVGFGDLVSGAASIGPGGSIVYNAVQPDDYGDLSIWEDGLNTLLAAGTGVSSGVEAAGALIELTMPDLGQTVRQSGQNLTDFLVQNMDPQWQAAVNRSWIELSSENAALDPRSWLAGIAQTVPYMVGTLGLGAGVAAGLRATGLAATKAGARTAGTIIAGGAVGAGEAAAGAGEAVEKAGGSEADRLGAMRTAAAIGAPAGAVLGRQVDKLASGELIGDALATGVRAAAGRVARRAGAGALGEAAEEGVTQLGTETGKATAGLEFSVGDVANAAIGGAAIGAPAGVALGYVADRSTIRRARANKAVADAEAQAVQAERDRIAQETEKKRADALASADLAQTNVDTNRALETAADNALSQAGEVSKQLADLAAITATAVDAEGASVRPVFSQMLGLAPTRQIAQARRAVERATQELTTAESQLGEAKTKGERLKARATQKRAKAALEQAQARLDQLSTRPMVQTSLFPDGMPPDPNTLATNDAIELSQALDKYLPNETAQPPAGYPEPPGSSLPLMDRIEASVRRSQAARAGHAARRAAKEAAAAQESKGPTQPIIADTATPATAPGNAEAQAVRSSVRRRVSASTTAQPAPALNPEPEPPSVAAAPVAEPPPAESAASPVEVPSSPPAPEQAPEPATGPILPPVAEPAPPASPADDPANPTNQTLDALHAQGAVQNKAPARPPLRTKPQRGVKSAPSTVPTPENVPVPAEPPAAPQEQLTPEVSPPPVLTPPTRPSPATATPQPRKRKLVVEMTPRERIAAMLTLGPQPVDRVLAALQDAYGKDREGAAFALLQKLRRAFPQSKKNPLKLTVRNYNLSNGFQGLYDPKSDTIYIDLNQAEDLPVVIMHEVVHAATLYRLRANLVDKMKIEAIMRDAADVWYELNPTADQSEYFDMLKGFRSAEEFIAETLTNFEFADMMQATPSPDLKGRDRVFGRFVNRLAAMFGLNTEPKAHRLFRALMDFIPDGAYIQEGNRQEVLAELDRLGLSAPVASLASWYRASLRAGTLAARVSTGKRQRVWGRLLPTLALDQLARSYGHLTQFTTPQGYTARDSINNYYRLVGARSGYAAKMRRTADSIVGVLKNVAREGNAEYLDTLMYDARMWGIHPDLPPTHPDNTNTARPGGMDLWRDLNARWRSTAMTPLKKTAFQLVRANSAAIRDDHINQIMLARVRMSVDAAAAERMEQLLAQRVVTQNIGGIDLTSERVLNDAELTAFVSSLAVSPQRQQEVLAKLKEVKNILGRERGPYIPLRRRGDYYAMVQSDVVSVTNLSAARWATMLTENRTQHGGDMEIIREKANPNGTYDVKYRFFTVSGFDNEADAREHHEELKRDYARRNIQIKVSRYAIKADNLAGVLNLPSSASVTALMQELRSGPGGEAAAQQTLKYYLEHLPDTSVRKSQLRARKIAGANTDLTHVYANYSDGAAYTAAQMRFGHKLSRVLNTDLDADIDGLRADRLNNKSLDQATDLTIIQNHLKHRDATYDRLTEEGATGSNTGFMKYWHRIPQLTGAWLLTGPGTMLTNAMQTPVMTLPHLGARYGYTTSMATIAKSFSDLFAPTAKATGREGKAFAKGLKKLFNPSRLPSFRDPITPFFDQAAANLDPTERKLMHDLALQKKLDFGLVADIQSVRDEAGPAWTATEYLMDGAFIIPQAIETMNRMVAALSAYRLRKSTNPNATYDELLAYSADTIDTTQFNYTQENRAPIMRHEILRPAMVFKTYPQAVLYTVLHNYMKLFDRNNPAERKIAIKFLGGMAASTFLVSGMMGILAFEPFLDVFLLLLRLFTDESDPEAVLRAAMHDYVNGDLLNFVLKGPLYAAGIADTSRMGMPQIFPMQSIATATADPNSTKLNFFGAVGEALLGAPGSVAATVSNGAIALANGDYATAVEAMTPKAFGINDVIATFNQVSRGAVDSQGNTIRDPEELNFFQALTRLAGFQPPELSGVKAARRRYYSQQSRISAERQELMAAFAEAQLNKDFKARDDALRAVRQWNKANPLAPITRASLLSSLRTRAEGNVSRERYGVAARSPAQIIMAQRAQELYE